MPPRGLCLSIREIVLGLSGVTKVALLFCIKEIARGERCPYERGCFEGELRSPPLQCESLDNAPDDLVVSFARQREAGRDAEPLFVDVVDVVLAHMVPHDVVGEGNLPPDAIRGSWFSTIESTERDHIFEVAFELPLPLEAVGCQLIQCHTLTVRVSPDGPFPDHILNNADDFRVRRAITLYLLDPVADDLERLRDPVVAFVQEVHRVTERAEDQFF